MTPPLDGSPLEEQIAQWRMYLRRRQAINGPDVTELEGHLRDQLAALTEAGLAGDEAFLVAVKRMGSLDALSREFALEHSERLWKQLVIDPDAADDTPNTARTETLIVLGSDARPVHRAGVLEDRGGSRSGGPGYWSERCVHRAFRDVSAPVSTRGADA